MVATPLATTVPNRPHTADAIAPASMPVRMLWRLMRMRMKFWAEGPGAPVASAATGVKDQAAAAQGMVYITFFPCSRAAANAPVPPPLMGMKAAENGRRKRLLMLWKGDLVGIPTYRPGGCCHRESAFAVCL